MSLHFNPYIFRANLTIELNQWNAECGLWTTGLISPQDGRHSRTWQICCSVV
uniref:Shufflon protein B n=1 Tax=Mesocestoides corti TaxID=53468 RepID=A0A5K3EW01_MESCO